jgi:hypothetical protein
MVVPFGPADGDYSLSSADAASALRALGGMLVRTTGGFGKGPGSDEWYAVVCRKFTDVHEKPSANVRSKLRRGLRNCEVRPISAEELAASGYQVYAGAQQRYGDGSVIRRESFVAHTMAAAGFEDVTQHWGVFCDETLAGYSSNYLFGTTEALYATLRFDPAYFRRYTSYALFQRMGQHYLGEQGFAYVNNGLRSILHDTQVQDFLEHNFGFERAYTPVDVKYRLPYGALVRATFPLRGLLSRLDRRLGALYELERSVRVTSGEHRA